MVRKGKIGTCKGIVHFHECIALSPVICYDIYLSVCMFVSQSLSAAHMITTAHASTDSEQQESVTVSDQLLILLQLEQHHYIESIA